MSSKPLLLSIVICVLPATAAMDNDHPVFRADVDVVSITFTVTDGRTQYVSGLTPGQIAVYEDGVEQQIHTFAEEADRDNVFILFDTSNCMYDRFSAQLDAIANFVRSLGPSTSVAIYTFSRNLFRVSPLSPDHELAVANLRERVVAGDDTALYNAILLTARDAANVPGRKSILVFSNGPDNASVLSPDDVARVAEDEGIAVYAISTRKIDEITHAAVRRMTREAGGRFYVADSFGARKQAFADIRRDLKHSYTVSYYPARNPNQGFRRIEVRIKSDKGLQVHARQGYNPRPNMARAESAPTQ